MTRSVIGNGVALFAVGVVALLAGCQRQASVPAGDTTGPIVSNDSQHAGQGTSSALREVTLEVTGMS